MSRTVRYILAALCLAGAAFFLLPLAAGILHFGMVWPAAVLLLAAAVLLRPDFSAVCCVPYGSAVWWAAPLPCA